MKSFESNGAQINYDMKIWWAKSIDLTVQMYKYIYNFKYKECKALSEGVKLKMCSMYIAK